MSQNDAEARVIADVPKLLWGGLDTYTDDLMVASTLRVCLDFIGEKHNKAFLAGVSGAAFDLGWGDGSLSTGAGGAVFAHPNHFEAGLENLFRATGREYTVAYKSEPDRVWEVAVESIDRRHPVVASEWAIDHFAVLAGYDEAKKEFLGWRYAGKWEAPEEYVRIALDALAFVVAIGGKTEKISRRQAALGALRFAVASARTGRDTKAKGQGGTSHGMVYGPLAYEEHARLVPTELDPNADGFDWRMHVLHWRLDALQLARGYAVMYLQEIEDDLSAAAGEHVRTAAHRYCELLGLIALTNHGKFTPLTELGGNRITLSSPHVRLFADSEKFGDGFVWCEDEQCRPVGELLTTPEGRQEFADWLLRLRDAEKQAVEALEKALDSEGGGDA